MFRKMFKDILNHPSLQEAARRCASIEQTQKEILSKLDELSRKIDRISGETEEESEDSNLHSDNAKDALSLEVIDLSRRVYFLEMEIERSEPSRWKIVQRVRDSLQKHHLLLIASALCAATFFGIYALYILNS